MKFQFRLSSFEIPDTPIQPEMRKCVFAQGQNTVEVGIEDKNDNTSPGLGRGRLVPSSRKKKLEVQFNQSLLVCFHCFTGVQA